MTPEAQRIAIATVCGWTQIQPAIAAWGHPHGIAPQGRVLAGAHLSVPDYLNDLNAMHEAEKGLTPGQQAQYAMALHGAHGTPLATFWHRVICATAAQRAEAFLKTLNLWTDK